MQPHAEMVHWLFGAGILFVGLCLLCEALVGTEVWRMRRWRAYLWPSARVLARRAALAGDGVLHELRDPHVRARLVGRGADARRRGRARARARTADVAALAARRGRSHSSSPAPRSSSTSRTRGSSPGRRSCITLLGWTFIVDGDLPARAACGARARPRCAPGFALMVVAVSVHAPLRPRRRARSSGTCRRSQGRSTGEARRRWSLVALAFPAAASAHATLRSTTPSFGSELQRGAAHDPPPLRPARRRLLPGSVRVLERRRPRLCAAARTPRADRLVAPRARRSSSAPTPFAGARSPPTRMSSPASGRSVSASRRRRRRAPTAPAARRRPSISCAGCGSSASR